MRSNTVSPPPRPRFRNVTSIEPFWSPLTAGGGTRLRMESARHWLGFFHVAMAAAVAVQVLVSGTYDADLSDTVWLVLNWLMAVAVITAVVFSYRRWRGTDTSARGTRVLPGVMLVASILLLVLYFEQWHHRRTVGVSPCDVVDHRHLVRRDQRYRRDPPPARIAGLIDAQNHRAC